MWTKRFNKGNRFLGLHYSCSDVSILMYRWFWNCETFLFSWAKHTLGHFEGFFEGVETFLTPELAIFGVIKVEAPWKISRNAPLFVFLWKKIISCTLRIRGTMVFYMSRTHRPTPTHTYTPTHTPTHTHTSTKHPHLPPHTRTHPPTHTHTCRRLYF
jgi:hypothetical protein